MRKTLAPTLGVALSLIVTGHAVALASAAMITVNSTADNTTAGDGQCTLREAITNVNAIADTTSGDCTAGTGSGDTITFAVTLPTTIKLTLGELHIEQNVALTGPPAGSLRVSGRGSLVFMNTAGATSISDLIIQKGASSSIGSGGSGGGIYNFAGTMTLTNCTLSGNRANAGGGIYNNGGTMTLNNCTLSRNSGVNGGGIYNQGIMTLTNCTLSRNRARGRADGGLGGGIYNNGGTMTLTNCTLSRNQARGGGSGISLYGGMMTLTNCTLRGGIKNGPFFGGGTGGTLTLLNTIVASSTGVDCEGSITSNGHNLDSDGTCFTSGGTDLVDTDPMLAPLAKYGGATDTMALCAGVGMPSASCGGASPAIDAGDDAVLGPPDNLATDQRGLPRKAGLHIDIGAYEVQ